jgi:hypothetical protein
MVNLLDPFFDLFFWTQNSFPALLGVLILSFDQEHTEDFFWSKKCSHGHLFQSLSCVSVLDIIYLML